MSDEFKKIQAKSLGVLSHHRNRDPLQCSVRSLFIIIQQCNCEALGARCLCSIFGQRPAVLCLKAFPVFQKVFDQYENNPDAAFPAINVDDRSRKSERFSKRTTTRFQSGNRVRWVVAGVERFEIKYLPTLVIVDQSGNIRIRHIGYSKAMEDYATQIREYIEEFVGEDRPSIWPEGAGTNQSICFRKFQISKDKSQIKLKLQITINQTTATIKGLLSLFENLEIGHWMLIVIWLLRFVISSLAKKDKTSRFR